MVAPTPTARVTPNAPRLKDGFSSLITFAADSDVALWEIGVKPPGQDGGDEIDTTTMHNVTYRSRSPRALITLTNSTARFAYNPKFYTELLTLLNVETTITQTFPNSDTLAYYGFLKNVEPEELVEGEMPIASATIVPTNADPSTGSEEAPVFADNATP